MKRPSGPPGDEDRGDPQPEQPAPEIFDSPYQGTPAENGGVVGMLEVVELDLARLEADHHGQRARILIAGRPLGALGLGERVEVLQRRHA